ncbi:ATP-binding cassette sub-family C member 9-like [Saccoglossus kowalevskii]
MGFIQSELCGTTNATTSTIVKHVETECILHFVEAFVHAFFIVLMSIVLVLLGYATNLRYYQATSITLYPRHSLKWMIYIAIFIVLLCGVGEGMLTDLTRNTTTQPHLYVPQSLALVSAVMSLVYYHHMEYWDRPQLAWLLLVYWISSTVIELVILNRLIQHTGFDVNILRFDIIILRTLGYLVCLVLELNLLRKQAFECCSVKNSRASDQKKKKEKKRLLYTYNFTNIMSRVTFWSVNWVYVLGYKKPIEMSDLGCLPENFECKYQYKRFQKAYKESNTSHNSGRISLWRTYVKAYGRPVFISTVYKLISDTLGFIPPLAVGGVVAYSSRLYYNDDISEEYSTYYVTVSEYFSNGFVLLGVIFITTILKSMTLQYAGNISVMESIHIRTALQSAIYDKALRLTSSTLSSETMSIGQITNHMSVDCIALQWFIIMQFVLYTIPYQVIVILLLLYMELGIAALIGSSVYLIVTPLQYKISDNMSRLQRKVLAISDERLKKSNEMLQGIKLLKLCGWEALFSATIETVRAREIKQMMLVGVHIIITTFFSNATPIIVTLISFVVYSTLSPTPLNPEITFSSLALFNQLVVPLLQLPSVLGYIVNGIASTKRLQVFFSADEIDLSGMYFGRPDTHIGYHDIEPEQDEKYTDDPTDEYVDSMETEPLWKAQPTTTMLNDDKSSYGSFESESLADCTHETILPDNVAIQVTGASFSWEGESGTPTLHNITTEIPKGGLTMIVGLVGSGKSSLISAILGEMTILCGKVEFSRKTNSVSYVPQKPWLQNATFRNNILFGSSFDYARYQRVLHACSLLPDIEILPGGDMTEIGEKGINLSGGQKQRISLSRALYSKTDILILDDPLSALDVHVGSHLMEDGIINFLIQQEKRTVVLVTHQLQYLKYASKVIVVDKGTIAIQGNLTVIQQHDPTLYSEWEGVMKILSESEVESDIEKSTGDERHYLKKQVSQKHDMFKTDNICGEKLIEKEERETGSMSVTVFLAYAKAIKYTIVCLILALFATQGTLLILTNFWLSDWSEAGVNADNQTENEQDEILSYYLTGYSALTMSYVMATLLATSCHIIFSLFAAKRLHIALLRNIVNAPMRFFDTTPTGRILNRFSADTQVIDQKIWLTMNSFMNSFLQVVSALVVNSIVTPIFIAFVTPVLIVYIFLQRYYITTSREIQRLDSITRSPVFAHYSESLGGLSTIRAYRKESAFKTRLLRTVDFNNVAQLYLHTGNRWLGIRLEFLAAVIILISGLSGLVSSVATGLEPSLVGLSLTYAISISGYMTWIIRNAVDIEMQMNAVERVKHYTNIEVEQYNGIYNPPKDWPDRGDINIENISVRYATGLDPVLQDISIHFRAGNKIGICGRTGSGKSSLTLALFRIIDTFKGRILMDGVDISHVPLLRLRRQISIIPQDPVLFSGTIRFNMDPQEKRSDEEIWNALSAAQLKDIVLKLAGQLDSHVSDGGENFSVGQRQLFCLARSFLRNAKIVIMDEATASIDIKTDTIISHVVSSSFQNTTVLIIAHRMSTILDSNYVLVLSDGKVVEYDTPQNLLQRDDSAFSSLVRESGL